MDPNASPQPAAVPPAPRPKNRAFRAIAASVLGLCNIAAVLMVGFLTVFVLTEQAHPNPAGILIIALAPMVGLAVLAVCLLDAVCLAIYLFSHKEKPPGRKLAAGVGLTLSLGVLGLVGLWFYSNIHGVNQYNADAENQKAPEFRAMKAAAADHSYGFDMLMPRYVPAGYTLYGGKVTGNAGSPESIYFSVSYQDQPASTAFDIIDFSKRASFTPPVNCGFYAEPVNELEKDPHKQYPCQLIGKTASHEDVYYYPVPAAPNGEIGIHVNQEAYFMLYGQNVVCISFVNDPAVSPTALKRAEVLKVLNSLAPVTMDELVKRNIAADK